MNWGKLGGEEGAMQQSSRMDMSVFLPISELKL